MAFHGFWYELGRGIGSTRRNSVLPCPCHRRDVQEVSSHASLDKARSRAGRLAAGHAGVAAEGMLTIPAAQPLAQFQLAAYQTLVPRKDSLFELIEAALTTAGPGTLVRLRLAPVFPPRPGPRAGCAGRGRHRCGRLPRPGPAPGARAPAGRPPGLGAGRHVLATAGGGPAPSGPMVTGPARASPRAGRWPAESTSGWCRAGAGRRLGAALGCPPPRGRTPLRPGAGPRLARPARERRRGSSTKRSLHCIELISG